MFLRPASTGLAVFMLLNLQGCAATAQPPPVAPVASAAPISATTAVPLAILAAAGRITGEAAQPPAERRYVANGCTGTVVPEASPLWQTVLAPYTGLPVRDCAPVKPGLKARALVVLPDAPRIARWVSTACRTAGQIESFLERCGLILIKHVTDSNGWQFIVSGTITEHAVEGYGDKEKADPRCKMVGNTELLFSFRDGITATLAGRQRASWRKPLAEGCARLPQPSDAELEAYLTTDSARGGTKDFGRLAAITRQMAATCLGAFGGDGNPLDDNAWRRMVRQNLVDAWNGDTDRLLTLVARAIMTPRGNCRLDK